jgi:predicted Co/Zn/Cd cation transporter (cation efflux family)
MTNEIAAVCFVVAAIALIVSVIRDARSDARRIEENDKIRADFEKFLRTGNDKPWSQK